MPVRVLAAVLPFTQLLANALEKMEMAQVTASSTFGGDSDEMKGFGLAHLSYEPVNEALTLTPTFKIINL